MKKPYLRCAIATFGIVAGNLIVEAQSGAAAGSSAAGTPGTAGTATTGTGAVAPAGSAVSGTSSASTGGRANPAGTVNTIGGASALEANPNNVGANSSGITAPAAPGTAQSGQASTTAAQMNTLPAGVQTTLGGFAANGSLGSVTAVPGQPGTFRATVTQNGVPMEITVGPNGQILSRTPMTGTPGTAPNSGAVNAQTTTPLNGVAGVNGVNPNTTPLVAGGTLMPPTAVVMDQLPTTIQDAIRNQLGNAEASRILQQRTPNGVNYLVSYDQNGRPMTLIVGPDGRILSNGPAAVSTASARPDRTTTNATREVAMTLDELPSNIEEQLKKTAPYAEVRTVKREQRVGGDVYIISVREGDRAGDIVIDANGNIIRDTRRDLSLLAPQAPKSEEKPEGMPYDTLPVAIKNAVKAYAAYGDIRSITLGLDTDGRTVYDIIFYRDGRRDRAIIAKSGDLKRIEQNVSPVLELASTKPAVIAIGDLPPQVQDTIRRQTDNVQIKEIGTKEVANQSVYSVRWETNGAPVELLVSRDGTIIQAEGSPETDRADAPQTAQLDREEAAVVKVVDDTPGTQRATENVGAAAPTERGVSVTADLNAGDTRSEVKLSDAPAAVQDTAKKIAGSGTIQSISPKLQGANMVYEVRYLDNGQSRIVEIDRSGKVQPGSTTSQP